MIFFVFLVGQCLPMMPPVSSMFKVYIVVLLCYILATWESASTRPFHASDPDKLLSLANLTTLEVNGQRHAMTLRSAAPAARIASNQVPVLLILHGGPGVSDIPFLYESDFLLEEYFIVVHYDQRSSGKSCRYYYQFQHHETNLTIDQHVQDAVVIIEFLRREFHQDKIYLAGGSWGSVLAMLLAKQYAHYFQFVALSGVLVDGLSNELISREFILRQFPHAHAHLPMPPYHDRVDDLAQQRHWLNRAGGVYYQHPLEPWSHYLPFLNRFSLFAVYAKHVLLSPEFSWGDKARFESCCSTTTKQMMHELFQFNAYHALSSGEGGGGGEGGPQLDVPVLFLHGRHDHMCVMELVPDFVNALRAPWKQLIWFEKSGHFPDREESETFQQALIETFLFGNTTTTTTTASSASSASSVSSSSSAAAAASRFKSNAAIQNATTTSSSNRGSDVGSSTITRRKVNDNMKHNEKNNTIQRQHGDNTCSLSETVPNHEECSIKMR